MASNRPKASRTLTRASVSTIREPDRCVKETAKVGGLPETNVYCYFPTEDCIYTAVTETRGPG